MICHSSSSSSEAPVPRPVPKLHNNVVEKKRIPTSEFEAAQFALEDHPKFEVEESREDFKWVEKILPKERIAQPPEHESYPTPSGWIPQTGMLFPIQMIV